ncbi:tetratricopeptide repeat protein [Thermodesulfobacteriota bacterium]
MYKRNILLLGVLCLCTVLAVNTPASAFFGPSSKAKKMLKQEKYDEAIPLYKEYLSKKPHKYRARNELGFAYLKTGRLDEAIKEFNSVLKTKPGNPYAVLYIGLAHVAKGEFGKAIDTWQGFRDRKKPLVEEEIRGQLTLLLMLESQKSVEKALAEEKKIKTVKSDANTVAVCYYQDLSPDKSLRAFQKGLAAMVITDLSKIKSLKVVERLRLQALLAEMKLGQTGIVDPRTAPRVGRLLGAESIIVGNLSKGTVTATTTGAGKASGTSTVSVDEEKFYELSRIIVRDIAKILGIELTPEEVKAIGIPHTKVYKAFVHFGNALDALDAGKWKEAKNFFNKALFADPNFTLAREGAGSCPDSSSPGISALSKRTPAQLAALFEKLIALKKAAQVEADKEAQEAAAANASGGGCLAYDTLVYMADNSVKRVIDVRVGDMVKARDLKKGKMVSRRVNYKYRADQDHYYMINGELKVTGTHPVLTDNGKWVLVSDLQKGDRIVTLDGKTEITSFEKMKYDHRVYYLSVGDSHNYFVSAYGKNFYLIHNSEGGGGGK